MKKVGTVFFLGFFNLVGPFFFNGPNYFIDRHIFSLQWYYFSKTRNEMNIGNFFKTIL